MAKNTFIAYETIYDMLKELPDELYIKFSKAVFEYGFYGNLPEVTGIEKALWTQIQFCIDNSKEYRKSQAERRKNKNNQEEPEATESNQTQPNTTEHNQTQPEVTETNREQPNVNVNVNENVNKNVNTQTESEQNSVCEEPTGHGIAQKKLFELVQAHNASAPQDRKVPVSKNFLSFLQKEMREFYDEVGTKEKPEDIIQAFKNFLQIANSDTWQKSFSWRTFIRNYQNFTPDFFTLERYVNKDTDPNDATKRPENIFYFAHKDDPRFVFRAFRDYQDEWVKAGRPDGEAYYKLQDEWIRQGPPAGSFYTSYEKEA